SCITRINDRYLTHHLANDHLNVFIIDANTLQTIYFLNLIHHVLLYCKWSLDREDILRRSLSIRKRRTSLHEVAILSEDLPCERNEILLLHAILRFDDDLAVTTLDGSHRNHTIDLRYNSRVARIPCFEELGNPWKTTGDIPQLSKHTRNLHKHLSCPHLITFIEHDMASCWKVV